MVSYNITFIQRKETFLLNEIFIRRIKRTTKFWKLRGIYGKSSNVF
jgi:hypothetical protein